MMGKVIRVVLHTVEEDKARFVDVGYVKSAEIREEPHGLEIEIEMCLEEVKKLAQAVIFRETARLRAALAESWREVQHLRSFLPPPIPLEET